MQAPTSTLSAPVSVAGAVLAVSGLDTTPSIVRPASPPKPPEPGFRNAPPCSTYYGEKLAITRPPPDRGRSDPLRQADGQGMESLVVECLHCSTTRVARRDRFKHFESPECPECGYLGWTPVLELTEAERREPRERRHAARRLPSVA